MPWAASGETISSLGTPGLIDLPNADVLGDGEVALTTNRFGNTSRNTAVFQVFPRLYGVFRYSILRDFERGSRLSDRFDRSFDLHYQVFEETASRPALAVGLRDFGGTGILSSEYLVATKHLGPRLEVTGGLGWGRLAQRGAMDSPLGVLGDRFETRPDVGAGGINATGQLDFGAWFRGPVAFFGGVEYQATDRLSLQVEYSSDAYDIEVDRGVIDVSSPVNVGLSYSYPSGSSLRAFVVGGTTVGLQYSYVFDPAKRRAPGGLEAAPLPIPPRNEAVLASWAMSEPTGRTRAEELLGAVLKDDGITLDALAVRGDEATVRIRNRRYDIEAQAIGRTARAMANVLPASVTRLTIIPQPKGLPTTAVTFRRSDLEELQTHYDGAWLSLARSRIEDAPLENAREGELAGAYPRFSYSLSPYTSFSFFDPDQPLRFDFGPELSLRYAPQPGLSFNGKFRYPIYSSIDDATRTSNSVLPKVRSNGYRYAIESDFEINRLTVDYLFRPAPDLFGRITAGYLETMYAGVSTELLWYPVDSRLALGAELNYAVQRDFDMLFGLQDYDIVTGHVSAYYDFENGFLAQIDAGRYLAGDWGATVALDREFNNGFKIGAYFTLTDVSFEDFGEGSFDKGIRFEVPVSWLTGKPSRNVVSQTLQPVTRDGGARLHVPDRLYETTRDYRAVNLTDGWGRFFR
ncbi:MAG: hypothetical protein CSA72_09730 [Rhodobacterales bacterium]|nr:MAG: hypothetical protein CSA72_09730 [Rhodobacterales bacterium]